MVKKACGVPQKGDLVWLDFSPPTGHEQAGRRPALCLSPVEYNQKVGLAIFCPVTSAVKGYPFEVKIPADLPVSGVILADQVKSMDWQVRNIEYIASLPAETLQMVTARIHRLI